MLFAASFLHSTIGKKIVMAITGLILVGFLIVHMAGNLQVFLGAEVFDAYAATIKSMPPVLWGTRFVLLASVALHIWAAVSLAKRNAQTRPTPYRSYAPLFSKFYQRTMKISGVVLLVFIVFHLLHFTTGTVHPRFDVHKPFQNLVIGFSSFLVALFYVVAMVALSGHLAHGLWSFFQTLGLNHPKYNKFREYFAFGVTAVVCVGFVLIPLAVFFGVVKLGG